MKVKTVTFGKMMNIAIAKGLRIDEYGHISEKTNVTAYNANTMDILLDKELDARINDDIESLFKYVVNCPDNGNVRYLMDWMVEYEC